MAAKDRRQGGGSPRMMRAPQAIVTVISTLILAAVLNADALIRDAETMPFGESRDRWLRVWSPFERAGDALLLDEPRAAIDDLTGRYDEQPSSLVLASPLPDQMPVIVPAGPELALPAVAVPTPTPEPTVRAPSPAQPLRLWVAGDSLAIRFGESLSRRALDTGVIEPHIDARISTGLARPDYFDWPGELVKVSEQDDPDIVVMMFGSNDSQGIADPVGEVYGAHTQGWEHEYRRRVAATLDIVAEPDRLVVWVGLPPMRDGSFSERLAEIDRIYREEAAAHPGVVYVDTWQLFSDAGGGYVAYIDEGGEVAQVREPDGVHLTRAGGDRLADAVMASIDEHIELAPSATTAAE